MVDADDIILYLLGGIYEALLVLYCISFYGFRRGKGGLFKNWKPRETFHVLIIFLLLTRGLYFLLAPSIIDGVLQDFPLRWYLVWLYLDSLLYYYAYLVLVLYWANEFFAVVYGSDRFFRKYRWGLIIFSSISVVIAFTILMLYLAWASDDGELGIMDNVSAVYLAFLNVSTTLGFVIYAIHLYFIMRKYHFPVDVKRKKARRLGYISGFCSFFFTVRSLLSMLSVIDGFINSTESSKEFDVAWYYVLIFYLLFEIVPLCAMLLFYRKTKDKKAQQKIDYESSSESEYGSIKSDNGR